MPLQASFFEAKDTIDKTEEYQTPEVIKVEDNLDPFDFPNGLLNTNDEVPVNSLIRKKTVIQETYFQPAEAVSADANTGCTIYKVHYEAKQFFRYYLVHGMAEYLVKEEPKGQYQIDRYIQHCPNGQITVTEWHENPAIGTDHHDGQLAAGKEASF